MIRAMTRNLAYRTAAMDWLTDLASTDDAPDVLFLQEVIPRRLDSLRDVYDLFMAPEGEGTGRHSAVAVRMGARLDARLDRGVFGILGSYSAVVRVELDRPIILASVHTSPRPYDGAHVNGLIARSACEVDPWWSDALVLEMAQHREMPMVVAGDFNEAREWDVLNPGHTCGAAFFESVETSGFVDITYRDWEQREHPTRFAPDYQLDRVFASGPVASLVAADDIPESDQVSDHAPIHFTIAANVMS